MTIWGVDLSWSSPGICCVNASEKRLRFWYLYQKDLQLRPRSGLHRVSNPGNEYHGWLVEAHALISVSSLGPHGSYEVLSGTKSESHPFWAYLGFFQPLLAVMVAHSTDGEMVVHLENYAMQKRSASDTPLKELGGVFRVMLFTCVPRTVRVKLHVISPSLAKKVFSGRGAPTAEERAEFKNHATKIMMRKAWFKKGLLDFRPLLRLSRFSPQGNPGKPEADMVDALALASVPLRKAKVLPDAKIQKVKKPQTKRVRSRSTKVKAERGLIE